MQEREGKEYGPNPGPLQTSKKFTKITRHKEMRLDKRRKLRKGNMQRKKLRRI
jgi:hypothetical protein